MHSRENGWIISLQGVVQSVGFRPFVKKLADKMGIRGYVRNLGDAGVEIGVIEVDKTLLREFIERLKKEKPELAEIVHLEYKPIGFSRATPSQGDGKFKILPSLGRKGGNTGFSALPPDISICDNCLEDMKRQKRRRMYAFTSCTDCGPRYSTILGVPYDRPRTSFADFPLCSECLEEYSSPDDRRFHAQTTCCIACGPQYQAVWWDKGWKEEKTDWNKIATSLREGSIWAVMGIGGTHYFLNALDAESVRKFRAARRRKSNKPFAVMMRDLNVVKKFCHVSPEDIQQLLSVRRPIVILPAKNPEMWREVSPGLDTIGVMLPYTGIHYILFWSGAPEVLVATSANFPGIPMPIDPREVLETAKGIADGVLIHNRRIVQRIDDSVVKSLGNHHVIIRRSRGFVPQPRFHKSLAGIQGVALGAEENNTAAVVKNGWVIQTQHLGHVTNIETLEFERNAVQHLFDLFDIRPNFVAVDLHPSFHSRGLGVEIVEEFMIPLIEVQHHVAHACSLMLDHGLGREEEVMVWACDGFGHGTDGQAWGGELIIIEGEKWERQATLKPVRYDGGDRNASFPGRMLILYALEAGIDVLELARQKSIETILPNGKLELDYLLSLVRKKPRLVTSSVGRLLDALSVLLEAGNIRSYRGEPAMRLEALALLGKKHLSPKVFVLPSYARGYELDGVGLFKEAMNLLDQGHACPDIALWAHRSLAISMGEIARLLGDEKGIERIGFSGGVAYNKIITENLREFVVDSGLEFLMHKNVAPGDAGISAGQLYYAGGRLEHGVKWKND